MNEEDIVNELKKLNSWMKIQSRNDLKTMVEELDDINKVLIAKAGGEKSVSEFVEKVPRSRTPVYQRLKKMEKTGILRKNSESKFVSQCDLEDLNIQEPELEAGNDG